MAEFKFKVPTSKEEMDELRESLRSEISEDQLDDVVGGNDNPNLKGHSDIVWTCPFCGAVVKCKKMQDAAKHMTKCPNNPYK